MTLSALSALLQAARYCVLLLNRNRNHAVTQARDRSEDPRPAPAGERGKPTRITIDLAAELYSYLRGYARGRDIAAADVVRELIRQMRNDPDLSARVTAELARRREALAEAMRAARE